ncbi:DNA-directed RNA polymerase sigma-70 factor [Gemmatimonadetes bacterium T265]|nr:DNA-directed RNA polymerase sigma-70 factor [Gemmatimonadetes bacterium T265]
MPDDGRGSAHASLPDMAGTDAPTPWVTDQLRAWGAGDRAALDAVLPVIYAELRRQAVRAMRREGDGHTLSATALVHEVYLRLAPRPGETWRDRAQFFGAAAHLMRQVLVDYARTRLAAKRGGGAWRVTLGHAADVAADETAADGAADVLAVHVALERLAAFDPAKARLVEVRYFGGLTLEETAVVLEVSLATVKREWAVARAWLRRELAPP